MRLKHVESRTLNRKIRKPSGIRKSWDTKHNLSPVKSEFDRSFSGSRVLIGKREGVRHLVLCLDSGRIE
jgi:hypothetical protein